MTEEKTFVIELKGKPETVSIDRLKPAYFQVEPAEPTQPAQLVTQKTIEFFYEYSCVFISIKRAFLYRKSKQ